MKELVRLNNVSYEDLLSGYNLSVYENEIVYIQSLSYRSLHVLAEFFSCQTQIQSGTVSFQETTYNHIQPMHLKENGIVRASFGEEFIDTLSIAENMFLHPEHRKWNSLYSRKEADKTVKEYLIQYGIDLNVNMPMYRCSLAEKRKLSLIRAAMMQAKLIVIEATSFTDEGYQSEELIDLIQKLHQQKISFLILASRYHPVCRIASRVQYVRYGMNVKEWVHPDETVFDLMQRDITTKKDQYDKGQKRFIGMYDYQWTDEKNIWQYLHTVKNKNPYFWKDHIGVSLPEEGISCNGETVIIPRTSFMELIDTCTIKQNLTVAIPSRITNSGIIQHQLEEKIYRDFCRQFNIDEKAESIDELTRLQKKILSIERFVLAKPKAVFLEDPYRSVHMKDILQLRAYLFMLADKGIRIFCFSRSTEAMQEDCFQIYHTEKCKI